MWRLKKPSARAAGACLPFTCALGRLSGVVKEAAAVGVRAWLAKVLRTWTPAGLLIVEVPIVIDCPVCRGNRPARSIQEICCNVCGTPSMDIVSGRELEVIAMELSDEHANAAG